MAINFSIEEIAKKIGINPAASSQPAALAIPTLEQLGPKLPYQYTPPAHVTPIKTGITASGVLNFAKDVVQSLARSGGSFGLQLMKPFGGPDILDSGTTAQKIIFGGPVKSIDTRVDEAIKTGKEFAAKTKIGPLKNPSLTGPLAGIAVGASIALDFTGFGGEEKALVNLAKATKVKEVSKLLKGLELGEETIAKIAPVIAKTGDKAIIKGLLTDATKVFETAGKERKFITSTKEVFPELKISGQYIPRSTDELAQRAVVRIKTDIAGAEKLAKTGTDDEAVATASVLIHHYGNLARGATGAEQIAFYDKAAEIATTIAPKLTEQGRSIQAASILGNMTPEGQLRFAARTIQKYNEEIDKSAGKIFGNLAKKVPDLSGEQAKVILDKAKKIQDMGDGIEKAKAFHDLQNEITKLVPSSWYQKSVALWKAGLLTGVKTSGLNTFANLFHGVSESAKDLPAVAVDKVASLFTGKRTIALTGKGTGSGVIEGFQKGWQYLKTGFDERNIGAKLDYKQVNFGNNKFAKALQKYEETVFRVMGSEDQPFYYGAKARSMISQATAEAINKGLKGTERAEYIKKLVANPTDQMLKYAVDDAEIAVFQNRTILGDVASKIQKIPGGEIVVPFGRTPSSVATQLINYSPAGFAKTLVANIGKGRFDQRLFAQGIGRAAVGTGVIWAGTELFKQGRIALGFPTNEREQKQWELEGKKLNSIKIGNKWRQVTILGPLGNALLVGGYFQQGMEKTGSFSNALTQATTGGAKTLLDQTFLQGLNSFTSAINDPEGYGPSLFSNLSGSIVPTLIGDIAKATDPNERRTNANQEGLLANLQARIPGLRENVEPRVDVFGRPVQKAGNIIESLIDPSRPTRIKSNALIAELRRLSDAGYLSTPTQFAEEKTYTQTLTAQQRTYVQERAGQILEGKLTSLIKMPEYKKLDDEQKKKVIQDFTDKSRVVARAELVQEIVQGLKDKSLQEKLGELKSKGFLTKQVFQKWQELY